MNSKERRIITLETLDENSEYLNCVSNVIYQLYLVSFIYNL